MSGPGSLITIIRCITLSCLFTLRNTKGSFPVANQCQKFGLFASVFALYSSIVYDEIFHIPKREFSVLVFFFFMYKDNRFLAPSEEKLHCKPSRHFPFIAPYANTLASLKIKDYFALSNSHSFVFIYILCMYNWILNIIVLHIIGIEFYMDLSKFFISCFFCSVLYL